MPNQAKISDKLKLIKLSDIIPFDKNAKVHTPEQINLIKSSLENNKYVQPLAVDKDNVIVMGHGRFSALSQIDPEMEIEVVNLDYLSKKECGKLRILDNKSNESAWDNDILAGNFDDIFKGIEINTIDISEIGFDSGEIGAILKTSKYAGKEDIEDEVPEVPKMDYIKPGDLVQLGKHKLLCGDSTQEGEVNFLMGGDKITLMNTDPPYGVNYGDIANSRARALDKKKGGDGKNYHTHDDKRIINDELSGEKLQEFLEKSIKAIIPNMIENPAFYLWHPMLTQGTFFAAAAAAADILIHRQIIWVKPSLIMGRGDFHWRHELCFYGWIKGKKCDWYSDHKQDTVWEIGRENNNIHPTQKPVEIFEKPLIFNTKPNDCVYEPFAGSGSQFIACEKTNRKCLGIEIDEHYCSVIIERYCKYTDNYDIKINGNDVNWNEYKSAFNVKDT